METDDREGLHLLLFLYGNQYHPSELVTDLTASVFLDALCHFVGAPSNFLVTAALILRVLIGSSRSCVSCSRIHKCRKVSQPFVQNNGYSGILTQRGPLISACSGNCLSRTITERSWARPTSPMSNSIQC